jgi:hypothetical protein
MKPSHAHPVPCAWILNLDAELELMRPQNYHPTKGSLAACMRFSTAARALLGPDDRELTRSEPLVMGSARGYVGRAWCPTPSVCVLLERAGATIEHAPSLACLRTVNHRRFHAALGQTLPDAAFVEQLPALQRKLSTPSPDGWLAKRGFGFAGRGVRRMPAKLAPDDELWLTHALQYGGVQVEPWLPIIAEYSLHGYIDPTGTTRLGRPCRRVEGTVSSYALADEPPTAPSQALTVAERSALLQQAERTASALKAERYTGPFGIDAFAYEWHGQRAFNPRSEINARYTLAYATGML